MGREALERTEAGFGMHAAGLTLRALSAFADTRGSRNRRSSGENLRSRARESRLRPRRCFRRGRSLPTCSDPSRPIRSGARARI
jgi:hypothetical protein